MGPVPAHLAQDGAGAGVSASSAPSDDGSQLSYAGSVDHAVWAELKDSIAALTALLDRLKLADPVKLWGCMPLTDGKLKGVAVLLASTTLSLATRELLRT